MPEFSELLAFLKAVFWKNLPTIVYAGGVPPVITKLYVWITGNPVSIKSYIKWALIVGILTAMFMSWDEEYTSRLNLEKDKKAWSSTQDLLQQKTNEVSDKNEQIRDLRSQLAEKERSYIQLQDRLNEKEKEVVNLQQKNKVGTNRNRIREQLGIFLNSGEILKANILNGNNDKGTKDVSKWVHEVIDYIQKELGMPDTVQFINPPVLPTYGYGIPQDRNHLVNVMERHLSVLRQLTRQLAFN